MSKGGVMAWGAAALLVLGGLASVAPVLRESDQASLLLGALAVARGEIGSFAGFYLAGNQFASYLLAGGVVALAGWEDADTLVFATNLTACLVFSSGLLAVAVVMRGAGWGRSFWFAAALFAPVLVLSLPLLSANTISGGILLWLAVLMGARRLGPLRLAAVVVLTFAAVGARADALLCLPFLCWGTSRSVRIAGLARSGRCQACGVGALAALVVGKLVEGGGGLRMVFPPVTDGRIVAAYLVFGLGATGILLGLAIVLMIRNWRGAQGEAGRWIGLVALVLPLLFYGWQLYSPRHLLTTALLVLLVPVLPRGALLVGAGLRRTSIRLALGLAVTAAMAAPLIGLHLPSPAAPRLVIGPGTLYPTTDGHWPMGGHAHFLADLGRADHDPLDHNQIIWHAARLVDYGNLVEAGPVLVAPTGFVSVFQLAARLDGVTIGALRDVGDMRNARALADERFLLRRPRGVTEQGVARQASLIAGEWSVQRLIPAPPGESVVLVESPEGAPSVDPTTALARRIATLFRHREFREQPGRTLSGSFDRHDMGRDHVFLGNQPFEIRPEIGGAPERRVASKPLSSSGSDDQAAPSAWHYVHWRASEIPSVPGAAWRIARAETEAADGRTGDLEIRRFRTVLPAYMARSPGDGAESEGGGPPAN